MQQPTCASHFTGKERDTESGNDYFMARYYSSAMGRFMSPDWSAKVVPVPYAKLDNPQSLNLYAYVLNNPLGAVDPDGHGSILDTLRQKACNMGITALCSSSQQTPQSQQAQQQNPRQKWEAQNEKKVQARIDSFPSAPAGARMVLTSCQAKSCNYTLTGMSGTYYAYEHFANDGVAGAKDIGPIGKNDYTTSWSARPFLYQFQ